MVDSWGKCTRFRMDICCCGYFLHPEEKCDKGDLVAVTDLDQCTDCGECVGVCRLGGFSGLTPRRGRCYHLRSRSGGLAGRTQRGVA